MLDTRGKASLIQLVCVCVCVCVWGRVVLRVGGDLSTHASVSG